MHLRGIGSAWCATPPLLDGASSRRKTFPQRCAASDRGWLCNHIGRRAATASVDRHHRMPIRLHGGSSGSKRPPGNNFCKTRSADRSIRSSGKSRQHRLQNTVTAALVGATAIVANRYAPGCAPSAKLALHAGQTGLRCWMLPRQNSVARHSSGIRLSAASSVASIRYVSRCSRCASRLKGSDQSAWRVCSW